MTEALGLDITICETATLRRPWRAHGALSLRPHADPWSLPPADTMRWHWHWVPSTWIDIVQAGCWCLLLAVLPRFLAPLGAELSTRRRTALLLLALALGTHLAVPLVPFNWYSGVANVDLGQAIYSKATSYIPLPNQFLTFVLGFRGILVFNIVVGIGSVILLWIAARRAGYGERVSAVLGALLAITPMYVRCLPPTRRTSCRSACGRFRRSRSSRWCTGARPSFITSSCSPPRPWRARSVWRPA